MNNIIYREQLKIQDEPQRIMLNGGKILCLAEDREGLGRIDVWYEVPVIETRSPASFRIVGTGQPFENGWNHVGSVVMSNGLVWHVYREWVFDYNQVFVQIPTADLSKETSEYTDHSLNVIQKRELE